MDHQGQMEEMDLLDREVKEVRQDQRVQQDNPVFLGFQERMVHLVFQGNQENEVNKVNQGHLVQVVYLENLD